MRDLAQRCAEKIANPPQLGIPIAADLGEPPHAREELARYAARLGRVAAALDVARERFGEPLEARDDLRGLLGAYRHRAAAKGLAEDVALDDLYQPAHEVLWSAPCDLTIARDLVGKYQHAVRVATGTDTSPEPAKERS